jgi:death-on-curing protein
MIFLTVEEVINLHKKIIKATGGHDGLRDRGLLESGIYGAFSSYYDIERYPRIEEKAARYAFGLIKNHAFIDGNKRIGILSMLMILTLNEIKINYTQQELINLGLSIADGSVGYDDILSWIMQHKVI